MRRRDLMAGAAASVLTGRGALAQNVATDPIFQFVRPSPITLNLLGPLDSRWTFSRASQGTQVQSGVLSYAPNNLIFPSVNFFSNVAPSGSVDGMTQNAGTAPDGSGTAMALIPGSFNATHQFFRTFAGVVSTVFTHSIFVKAAGYNYVTISLENSSLPSTQLATFSLIAGTVTQQAANGSAVISALPNGWYRVSVQNTSASTLGNYIANIFPMATGTFITPSVGNSVDSILVWGQQVEQNITVNAYNPTTTAVYYGPRFETSPAGYLGEPQATNIIRNNTMVGAVAGVVGSGGAFPTNWGLFATSGLTTTIIGTGTQNGVTYLDFRLSGTSTGTFYVLAFDGAGTTASAGQVWTESFWASYVAGSLTNISSINIDQRYALAIDTAITVTATPTRVSAVSTALAATTTYNPSLLVTYPVSSAIDITLRIGLPQADLAAFTSSAIATSGTAATRAADNLTLDLTQLPGLQTAGGYSAAIEFSLLSNSQSQVVFGMAGSGGFSNTWYFSDNGAGGLVVTTIVATVSQGSAAATLRAVGLTNRLALTVTPAGITFNLNGAGDVTVTNAGMPVMTMAAVLRAPWAASNYEAGHATLVTLIPGPQSAAWRASRAY